MALNRGTRKEKFVYYLEIFAILGTVGGVGLGIFNYLGGEKIDMLKGAFEFGLPGFIVGTVAGVVVGMFAVIWDTLFNR
jgi:hypothetical protein